MIDFDCFRRCSGPGVGVDTRQRCTESDAALSQMPGLCRVSAVVAESEATAAAARVAGRRTPSLAQSLLTKPANGSLERQGAAMNAGNSRRVVVADIEYADEANVIMKQGGRERLNDKWRGLRVFSAADGETCPTDLKGTTVDFEWWGEDEHGEKLKPPMYVSVVEDDDGERWPIGVASLPEMVLAADDQPRNVRLGSNGAVRDMGTEEVVAESDRIMAAMTDDTRENDEDDDESTAAPVASVTSSETPAAKDQRHVQRRPSGFCADGGADVPQTRGDCSARPPGKKKARCEQGIRAGAAEAAGCGSSG